MLVGHFAVAFIGKRVETKLSLGTLSLAAMLPDILWTIFTLTGIEYKPDTKGTANQTFSDVAWSHSLLMVAIWAALFAGSYFLWQRYRNQAHTIKAMRLLFAAVLSHWFLDAISHKHLLAPGRNRYVGLELWDSLPATLIIEGGFWLLAITLYVRATSPIKRAGIYTFWLVIAFLTYVWVANIRKGPPPPNAVMGSLIFFVLLIGWAYWMNRLRPNSTDKKAFTNQWMNTPS